MVTKETPVKTVRIEAFCECGGTLVFNGIVLTVYPPIYPHSCSKCHRVENLSEVYPTIEHR